MRSVYPGRGEQGFALLITLAVLALIVTVVVLFATMTGFESKSARSQLEVERSRLYATMAVNDVIAKLRDNIPVASTAAYLPSQTGTATAGPNCAWAAAPGRLVVPDSTQTPPFRTVPLYSGTATAANSVDLNQPIIGESGQYPIIPINTEYTSAVPMKVAWIYVCKDGTKSIDTSYAPTAANPLVGRYAYWTDTETSKVNLNTAGNAQLNYQGLPAPYNPNVAVSTGDQSYTYTFGAGDIQNLSGHPSRVDLSKLDGGITLAQSLATYRYTDSSFWQDFPNSGSTSPHGLGGITRNPTARQAGDGMGRFNKIEDWINTPNMPSAITSSQVEANKFYLTTRAWTPELTPWGVNKLWLQENDPQTALDYGIFLPGDRLNAPGAPVFPANASNPPVGYGYISGTSSPDADFRYYVYPPFTHVDTTQSTQDVLLATGNTRSAGNFQYIGPDTIYTGGAPTATFMDNLMFQLKRRDWPGMPAKSFVDKYGQQECEDMAFNMLTMTDSAIGGGTFVPFRMIRSSPPYYSAYPGSYTGYSYDSSTYVGAHPDTAGAYGSTLFRYHDPTQVSPNPIENDRCFLSSSLGPLIKQVQVNFHPTPDGFSGLIPNPAYPSTPPNPPVPQYIPDPHNTYDNTTGTPLVTKSWQTPGFAPPVSDGTKYCNISMTPKIQLYYPRTLGHSAPFVAGSAVGPSSVLGISDIEVSATGTYNGANIAYSSSTGAVNSHFVWSNYDDAGQQNYLPSWGTAIFLRDAIGNFIFPGAYVSNSDYGNYFLSPTNYTPNGTIFIGPFDLGTTVTATIKFRAYLNHSNAETYNSIVEMAPLPPGDITATFPTGYNDIPAGGGLYPYVPDALQPYSTKLVFTKTITTDGVGQIDPPGDSPALVTLETSDPRDFRYASDWINTESNDDTSGQRNTNYYGKGNSGFAADSLTGIVGDDSKLIWPDVSAQSNILNAYGLAGYEDPRWEQNAGNITGFPNIGWFSALPTNCESSIGIGSTLGTGTWDVSGGVYTPVLGTNGNQHPWRTISLEPTPAGFTSNLPDWLLLEVYALAYDSTYLSQTQGKININADIQPFAGLTRQKPLQALLTPSYDYAGTSASTISNALANHTDISAGKFDLPKDIFLYPSEICEVASMGGDGSGNQFQREALSRDTVGLMTTQCSDFMVHAVAQSLAPNIIDPTKPGVILSEQRLRAVVSRAVDTGLDGIPGTSDDPQAAYQNGNTFGLQTLKFDGTDLPLLGYSGVPSFQYKVSNFNFLTR